MLRRIYDATWGRIFALLYDLVFARVEREGLRELRRRALAPASGRTLELGAGTGLNQDLYPPAVTELVLTEPFPPMARQLRRKVTSAAVPTTVVEAPAERLPFADASFDTVVATLVLCTARDPDAALREVARVLAPGGRLLFLEHVRSQDPDVARWQDRLHGPWYLVGHGCHCNRDTGATIESSPLRVARLERSELAPMPPIVRPMIVGEARHSDS